MTQETGPIYGVPLIQFLPMGETMRQAMPSRDDLEDCIAKDCERVAAGYEVLLAHYHKVCEERDRLKCAAQEALSHVEELREAWRTGAIREHDGKGGLRSNRNVDVEVKLRKAIGR